MKTKFVSPLIPASYSRLSKYERCPLQAKLAYTLKRPYVQSDAAARGSAAHKSMEIFLKAPGTMNKPLHDAIEPHRHVLQDLRRKKPKVELEIAVNRDWSLATWKNCWLRGGVDSAYLDETPQELEEHPGKFIVAELHEWKTGKMYDDHDDQRRLYFLFAAVYWLKAQAFRIQSYYFDLGKKKVLEATRAELDPIREDFNTRIHIMENDDVLAPRPGYYCRWCDFNKLKGGPCRFS